ncbi:hypothetical protein BGW80DRAFT_1368396 [Lactifluus volemus]|nr:hypothetical protein BGW80DRAFT_1368396 [Lactifluus volemus]
MLPSESSFDTPLKPKFRLSGSQWVTRLSAFPAVGFASFSFWFLTVSYWTHVL